MQAEWKEPAMGMPAIRSYRMPTRRELPPAQLPWRIDSSKAVLLIHDMQCYFLGFFPPGVPPVTDLVRNAALIRDAAAAAGVPVVYTAQPGAMTRRQRGLLYDLWGPGMDGDPEKRKVVPEVAPREGDVVLTKWRYSAFARSPLGELLEEWSRSQLVICGVYAHVGCLMTANDAYSRDVQSFLVADATADFTPEYHRLALTWAAERCAAVATTADVVTAFAAQASRPGPIADRSCTPTTAKPEGPHVP
jgi:isochorismate hydrolase